MSVKVVLPTAFIRHTDGQKQFASTAADLPGLLADIDRNFPALGTQIKGEDGKLRRFIISTSTTKTFVFSAATLTASRRGTK